MSEHTIYTWRKRFGTFQADDVRRVMKFTIHPASIRNRNMISTLYRLYRLFATHPLTNGEKSSAILRFVRFQVGCRVANAPVLINWIAGTRLIAGPGMTGVTGEVYTGLLEFEDTMFCLHLLRENDRFVDVGANAGTYSVAIGALVRCPVIAFEPSSKAAAMLRTNLALNGLEGRVTVVQAGASDRARLASLTDNLDALNRVVVAGASAKTETVKLDTLDNMLEETPTCLKIDIEGHEIFAIHGAKEVLGSRELLAVVMETGVQAHRSGVLDEMMSFGFVPCRYDPFRRELVTKLNLSPHNTIFVRSVALVRERLVNAPAVPINGRAI